MDKIEKKENWIWTEKDFEVMYWNDCSIYTIEFDKYNLKLTFDIDYIFKWIEPELQNEDYKFLIAPATLIFEKVYEFDIDLDSNLEIDINSINRQEEREFINVEQGRSYREWKWTIDTLQGNITFRAEGFSMYIRQKPKVVNSLNSKNNGLFNRLGIAVYKNENQENI